MFVMDETAVDNTGPDPVAQFLQGELKGGFVWVGKVLGLRPEKYKPRHRYKLGSLGLCTWFLSQQGSLGKPAKRRALPAPHRMWGQEQRKRMELTYSFPGIY